VINGPTAIATLAPIARIAVQNFHFKMQTITQTSQTAPTIRSTCVWVIWRLIVAVYLVFRNSVKTNAGARDKHFGQNRTREVRLFARIVQIHNLLQMRLTR
jgi:hypothetical protein